MTPSISSSRTKFSAIGGEQFVLTGTNLSPQTPCDDSAVFIGDQNAKIISWSDTEIVAETVSQEPENVAIKVRT